MKKFDDDKFIVINRKRFEELNNIFHETGSNNNHPAVDSLTEALDIFAKRYKYTTGRHLNQKYLVCNQNEPYALFVKSLILDEFVTPGQFEQATGREYPAGAPVWYAESDMVWKLRPYGEALQDWVRRDVDSLYAYMVCAVGDHIPADGFIPECCEKQWFQGD
jgi:hypothetical protein